MRWPLRAAVVGAALLLAAAVAAQTYPPFPLAEVRAGVVGYGLTASPNGIERFDVTLLGLHDGFGGGFPLVLIEASGGPIAAAGGVAAGMSGSPIFVPGPHGPAIVGAIGYAFQDAPGGLALVTPIEAMRSGGAVAAPGPGFIPVASPIVVAGLGGRSQAFAEGVLGERGIAPLLLHGGGGAAAAATPLESGAAIGVAWIAGDVDLIVSGTITEIDGGIWRGFGHPVVAAGAVSWPLVDAQVLAFVPRRSLPFRLAVGGDAPLGVVRSDRAAVVSGTTSGRADTLPVTLKVQDSAGVTTTLRYEVVRDEALWPTLVAIGVFEGLDRARGYQGGGTATIEWDVTLRDGPGVRLSEVVVDASDLSTAAARLAAAPLVLLARNPFAEPDLERLELRLEIDPTQRAWEVRQVLADAAAPTAGAMLPLFVRLQPWRRAGRVESIDVRLPETLHGQVEVVVRGGGVGRDDPDEVDPDDLPLTFDELLAFLRERPTEGDLVVEAREVGGSWVVLDRRRLPGFVTGRARLLLDVAAAP
jgi:hypothetical protein